jgi:general secretion pathway protein H
MSVRVTPRQPVVLNAEWFASPLQLQLSDGQHRLDIQRTATGQIRVANAP